MDYEDIISIDKATLTALINAKERLITRKIKEREKAEHLAKGQGGTTPKPYTS